MAIPGFVEQLGEEIALPLEVGVVTEARPGGFGGIDAGRLTVAAGLAVEEIAGVRAVNLIPTDARARRRPGGRVLRGPAHAVAGDCWRSRSCL